MSRKIYETIGHRMISSWRERWPEGILEVYSEDEIPRFSSESRIILKPLQSVDGFSRFNNAVSAFRLLCGESYKGYNYRYNLRDFSKKVFGQIAAASNWDQLLVWLDADVVTFRSISRSQVLKTCEGNFICYMGRQEFPICTSFLAWDNSIQGAKQWWSSYSRCYRDGYVFRFKEWNDAYVMNKLIQRSQMPTRNLSPSSIPAGPVNVFDIVFKNFAQHFKGDLKAPFFRGKRYEALYSWLSRKGPKRILEIGVGNTDNAIAMCQASQAQFYVGVDVFEDANLEHDEINGNLMQRITLQSATSRLRSEGINCKLCKGDSANILLELMAAGYEGSFDFVFVDGSKMPSAVEADFKAAFKLAKTKGEIGINGYCVGRNGDSLVEKVGSVNHLVREYDYVCLPEGDSLSEESSMHIAVVSRY